MIKPYAAVESLVEVRSFTREVSFSLPAHRHGREAMNPFRQIRKVYGVDSYRR